MPELKLLSNGRYHVMVTSKGGGYSRWNGMAVTRWREDATCDDWGSFCYLRDVASGQVWSTTFQPTRQPAPAYDVVFSDGLATFVRGDHGIETRTDIAVSASDDVEVRRVRLTNLGTERRSLDVTTCAEIVLAGAAADAAHPAFSKLFIQTDIEPALHTIHATRRPSASDDPTPWMFHRLTTSMAGEAAISYETDRLRFIGRGRTSANPAALEPGALLSGSAGPVLDAIAAIRCPVTLEAGASVTLHFVTGIAATREECVSLARKYQDAASADAVVEAASTDRQAPEKKPNQGTRDAQHYEQVAASLLYSSPALRANPQVIAKNQHGQSGLWGFGISGDLPIVLLQMADGAKLEWVAQLVGAHAYWRAHGIHADLVILAADDVAQNDPGQPRPPLFAQVTTRVAATADASLIDKPGGIFVRDNAKLDEGDRTLLQTVARAVFIGAEGSLAEQLDRRCGADRRHGTAASKTPPTSSASTVAAASTSASLGAVAPAAEAADALPATALAGFNGLGGFSPDGREYVITSSFGKMTPAPWVNVLANPSFGTLVSESGSASSWSENAHEFRLTPWSNDPVSDANTEALYIRDDASGRFWSPTLLPTASGAAPYTTRHGFGYSVFTHVEQCIASELCIYVAIDAPVKFSVLKLHNQSTQKRHLSVTGYIEWVLGDERVKTLMHVVTERDNPSGALFARNGYNTDFSGRTAFFDVDDAARTACADRLEFLGDGGTLAQPAVMVQAELSNRLGAALDPCGALRVAFELAPGEEREIVFRLGAGHTAQEARELVTRWRGAAAAQAALAGVHAYWQRTLGTVQVKTTDPLLDALANGWLMYQVIASRLWGRTAFYQSSGAWGFRDQLQDVMALVHAEPGLVREHLLRCAARQFLEGDVQHWWHPPSGKGVRTRCSDDYLWLPLATCRYVESTADTSVLTESASFLESRLLKVDEVSNYETPAVSQQSATLYEHCVRAIRHGLRFGAHGIPLMGSCDWNDGMNLVGAAGKGESVWLGFFLFAVLTRFAPLARQHGDMAFAGFCEHQAEGLRERIEASAWDGAWYQRAWFDDGSPLGTASNTECRIDSIAQSWSVLSRAADPKRGRAAMNAVDQQLVHRDAGVVQLLAPPFDHSTPPPGYIQGYVPGVRENGGQYTHAAVWATMAFAALGDAERAWQLLRLLNPTRHGDSASQIATYKAEPYVLAGDVYALAPHTGRGGWSWYTGSAGWMYQLVLESLLGFRRCGNKLRISPLLPADWKALDIRYHFGSASYDIHCRPTHFPTEPSVALDGQAVDNGEIVLVDDGAVHCVHVGVDIERAPPASKGEINCKSE